MLINRLIKSNALSRPNKKTVKWERRGKRSFDAIIFNSPPRLFALFHLTNISAILKIKILLVIGLTSQSNFAYHRRLPSYCRCDAFMGNSVSFNYHKRDQANEFPSQRNFCLKRRVTKLRPKHFSLFLSLSLWTSPIVPSKSERATSDEFAQRFRLSLFHSFNHGSMGVTQSRSWNARSCSAKITL